MRPADYKHLHDAIARNAGAVVSLPSAGLLRHHKARLLCPDEHGFWVEAPPGERPLINELMSTGAQVGVSLRGAPHRIVFATVVRQFMGQMQINAQTAVDALLMAWPGELKSIQRRSDYRVTVPAGAELGLTIWRIPEQHVLRDKPQPSTQLRASLRDLSLGGMCVYCTLGAGEPKPVADQRLRVLIAAVGHELVMEGRVKHVRPTPDGSLRLGVQFRKLDGDLAGRRTLAALTTIVGQLQRDEIRRFRLGRTG